MNRFDAAQPGDPADAFVNVGGMAKGETRVVRIGGLTAPTAAGTYNFRAFVDALDAVAEKSEGNNQKTKTFTLSAGSSGGYVEPPDFKVTAIVFSPDPLTLGATFTAFVTVENAGGAGDGGQLAIWLNHFAAAAPGEAAAQSEAVGTMAKGSSKTIRFSGSTAPTAKGTYTFRAFVDANNTTTEKSEGNNQKTKTYGFY